MSKKIRPRYSGKKSKRFWNRVNAIGDRKVAAVAFMFGCALQDMEDRALRMLDYIERAPRDD